MPDFTLRKTMIFIEEIRHDGGPAPALPRRRAAPTPGATSPTCCPAWRR